MARIIENLSGRRTIKLSTQDIISVVQQYQIIVGRNRDYSDITSLLQDYALFLPEDVN